MGKLSERGVALNDNLVFCAEGERRELLAEHIWVKLDLPASAYAPQPRTVEYTPGLQRLRTWRALRLRPAVRRQSSIRKARVLDGLHLCPRLADFRLRNLRYVDQVQVDVGQAQLRSCRREKGRKRRLVRTYL